MGDDVLLGFSPPPGVKPNFENPDSIAYMLYAAIGATLPVAILACSLRLYTSKRIVGRWHVDDGTRRPLLPPRPTGTPFFSFSPC